MTSPMWLARHHVCRRCLALYPLAIASMIAAAAGLRWPRSLDAVFLPTFPIPATLDFVLEQLGAVRYQPRRQQILMIPLAVAFGVGLARYIDHPADGLFWAVTASYCAVWGTTAVIAGGWRGSRS